MRSGWVALLLLWNVLAAAPPSPGLWFSTATAMAYGLDLQIMAIAWSVPSSASPTTANRSGI